MQVYNAAINYRKVPHMPDRKKWEDMNRKEKIGGVLGLIVVVIILSSVLSGGSKKSNTAVTSTNTSRPVATQKAKPSPTPTPTAAPTQAAGRQVAGQATTLGAGTFTGGSDVASGLYDVTPAADQSGNFMVDGKDSYNEILGSDTSMSEVSKARVQISSGDKIQISGLSQVIFTPVTAPLTTAHATTSLYAGTFIVGQDIGAGKYVVTPASDETGNFMVDGANSYNEILGNDSSMGEVPSVNVTLSKGDKIAISSLDQVIMTAQ